MRRCPTSTSIDAVRRNALDRTGDHAMSCETHDPAVLIAGAHVGWQVAELAGVVIGPDGAIMLASASPVVRGVSSATLDQLLYPSWLCPDGRGRWLVVDGSGTLRRVSPCDGGADFSVAEIGRARSVTFDRNRVAILTLDGRTITVFTAGLLRAQTVVEMGPHLADADLIGWVSHFELAAVSRAQSCVVFVSTIDGTIRGPFFDDRYRHVDRIGFARASDRSGAAPLPLASTPIELGWWQLVAPTVSLRRNAFRLIRTRCRLASPCPREPMDRRSRRSTWVLGGGSIGLGRLSEYRRHERCCTKAAR
jgi:hypothetical protein